ncbi:MAG: carboxypeptidase regulatory-like domain-containing protein [Armatimonadetes bacterium]|nr:carboxypeptidase regulatory-like domain-containing protein [Armatimonadota bacterium]
MRAWLRVATACLWVAVVGMAGCSSDSSTAGLSGRVTEAARQAGSALEGVRVFCAGRSVLTQPDGFYAFGAVPTGPQTVVATLPGYEPGVATVSLGGDRVTQDFELFPILVEFREASRRTIGLTVLGASLAVSPDGDIFVNDQTTIYRLDANGQVRAQWLADGLEPTFYGALTVDRDGLLNVLGSVPAGPRQAGPTPGAIVRYDRNGNRVDRLDLPDIGVGGLALGPDDRIHTMGEHAVLRYDVNGAPLSNLTFDADESVAEDGVAVDDDGFAYVPVELDVTDAFEYYIDIFRPDGTFEDDIFTPVQDGGGLHRQGVIYVEADEPPVIYRYFTDGTPLPAVVGPPDLFLNGRSFDVTPRGEIVCLTSDGTDFFLLAMSDRVTGRGKLPPEYQQAPGKVKRLAWPGYAH